MAASEDWCEFFECPTPLSGPEETGAKDATDLPLMGYSEESKATIADMKLRWSRIELCLLMGPYAEQSNVSRAGEMGAKCQWPQVQGQIETVRHNIDKYYKAWKVFEPQFDAQMPQAAPAISSQVSNLNAAEEEMRAAGADIKDRPKPAPDIADTTKATKAAQSASDTATAATEAVKDAGKATAEFIKDTGGLGIAPLWEAIPTWAKVAGGATLAAYLLSQAATISRVFR